MLESIHHIALLASRRERTVAFYHALGFQVESSHVRPQRRDEIIFMVQKGICLEIFVSGEHPLRVSDPEAYGLRHLAFRVFSAETVRKTLIEAGYQP